MYGVAVGTPVTLRAPSVPTVVTNGDASTLKKRFFILTMGSGIRKKNDAVDAVFK